MKKAKGSTAVAAAVVAATVATSSLWMAPAVAHHRPDHNQGKPAPSPSPTPEPEPSPSATPWPTDCTINVSLLYIEWYGIWECANRLWDQVP